MSVEAGEIRALQQKLETSSEGGKATIRAKLDRIADRRRFEGLVVSGEDAVDRENAISSLEHYGSESFAEYMYGD